MKKWIVLACLMLTSASVFHFFYNFERVVLEWRADENPDADHFVVYYGPESRHPRWDKYEEYFYAIEEANLFPYRIVALMEETDQNSAYFAELEKLLDEAEKVRDEGNKLRDQVAPYPNKKIVSGSNNGTTFWIRRGVPCYASILVVNKDGRGSFLSEEVRRVTGTAEEISRKDSGNWI